jgi:hypothetical protein
MSMPSVTRFHNFCMFLATQVDTCLFLIYCFHCLFCKCTVKVANVILFSPCFCYYTILSSAIVLARFFLCIVRRSWWLSIFAFFLIYKYFCKCVVLLKSLSFSTIYFQVFFIIVGKSWWSFDLFFSAFMRDATRPHIPHQRLFFYLFLVTLWEVCCIVKTIVWWSSFVFFMLLL